MTVGPAFDLLGEDAAQQMVRASAAAVARIGDAVMSAFLTGVAAPAMRDDESGPQLLDANRMGAELLPEFGGMLTQMLRRDMRQSYRPRSDVSLTSALVSGQSSSQARGSDRHAVPADSVHHRSARGDHLEVRGRIRMTHYEDKSIALDEDGVTIKNYRKPGDTKRIAYRTIRGFELFEMGFWSGRHRLVGIGFGRPRNWFQWDRDRKNKRTAISMDVGKRILPTATPDDPEAVETILRESVGTH